MPDLDKFKKILTKLESRFKVVPRPPRSDPHKIKGALLEAGIPVDTQALDIGAYEEWRARIDYERKYPEYLREFPISPLLSKKSLEHYVTVLLAPPHELLQVQRRRLALRGVVPS